MQVASFEKRTLAKDTLSAISQICIGKKFVAHDGNEYSIRAGSENTQMKCFIDVVATIQGTEKPIARYALVLIGLSEE